MQKNTSSVNPNPKAGCLKKFLIIFGVTAVLFIAAVAYIFDQISGNAEKRFEEKENARLAKEILPEEYKSYPDLYELSSTDDYEVVPLVADFSLYYILPDNTLILAEKFGANFLRINTDGEIIGHYYNPDLKFHGTSLMQYTVFTPPLITSDDTTEEQDIKIETVPEPIVSGVYSNWPINGDTTLFQIQPIEKIASTKNQKIAAYDKADVVTYEYIGGDKVNEFAFLHIGDTWYMSDYRYKEQPVKHLYKEREPLNRFLNKYNNITIKYKKRNRYNRARSAGYLSGGMLNFSEWEGDLYLDMKVGKTSVLFKERFKENKNSYGLIKVYFDVINMGNYVIINNYLIRQKKK